MQLSADDLFQPGDGLGAVMRVREQYDSTLGAAAVGTRPPKPKVALRKGYKWVWKKRKAPAVSGWKQEKKSTGGIFGAVKRTVGKVGSGAFRIVKGIARPVLRTAGAIALPGVAQAAQAFAEQASSAGASAGGAAQTDITEAQQGGGGVGGALAGATMGNILPIAALAVGAYLLMGRKGRR